MLTAVERPIEELLRRALAEKVHTGAGVDLLHRADLTRRWIEGAEVAVLVGSVVQVAAADAQQHLEVV